VPIDWDARYSAADQLWSGAPNGALARSVETFAPGRALDVGCGEGADAIWLASRGWRVTALDVSRVALDRAGAHAEDAGVTVEWLHSGLIGAGVPTASFDLVSAQYPVLEKSRGHVAESALLDAVAPGGTLVFVHHAEFRSTHHHDDFDPDDYLGPWDVVPLLGEDWTIVVNENRPRHVATGAGAGHSEDAVLVARRAAAQE